MNRIAIKIKEARLKANLTEKQLAKKCGLSESYIIQVESGKKVINETHAETILEKLGQRLEFVYDEEPKPSAEEKIIQKKEKAPVKEQVPFYEVQPTEQWQDALANLIKKYPVYEIQTNKVVGHKDLPIIGKKVEGYHWEKLLFVKAPDNELEALRIMKQDILLFYRTQEIEQSHLYLIEMDGKRLIRQLRREGNGKLALYKGGKGETPQVVASNQLKVIGKCVKVEFVPGPSATK